MKNQYLNIAYIITSLILFSGCDYCPDWSVEQKKQFEQECIQKENIDDVEIQYHGFKFNEIESVLVYP